MPSRFGKREFGFMFFGKDFVRRHMRFVSLTDIENFIYTQVPAHCYYSTAYYRKPDAPTIGDKDWLGADLVFDLDADHLAGAENMSYPEMLEQIKKEVIKLVDSFLLDDLGFDESQVHVVFSGGRGYHVHIEEKDVIGLDSYGRREIVDYITSNGLDTNWTVASVDKGRNGSIDDFGGWELRIINAMRGIIDDVCNFGPDEVKKLYPSVKNVDNNSIKKCKIYLQESGTKIFRKEGMVSLRKDIREFLRLATQDVMSELSGKIDEPVTTDTKRLIRLPGSIHGKSGLRVVPLSRDSLTDFDPLASAVPDQYSDDDVTIATKQDIDITIKDQHFRLSGIASVPEYVAVLLVGRGVADIKIPLDKGFEL
ncbi:MAG: DNA primase catalytic subunit PriS [archaeon]|nr:DNA primase catalytic subunit PriS [archaeon]